MLTREARPWFLLLDPGTHAAFAGTEGEPKLEMVAVELPALRTQVTGLRAPKQDEQTIRPDAKLLFVAERAGPRNSLTGRFTQRRRPD